MQIHELKILKKKKKKRVGRGGKRGTYSGRGLKGQKARAGRRIRPAWRDILKKLPKKRGYRAKLRPQNIFAVNLGVLEKNFEAGSEVSPKSLAAKDLIPRLSGKVRRVKILGSGKLEKKLVVKGCLASKSAAAAIKKAGGVIM